MKGLSSPQGATEHMGHTSTNVLVHFVFSTKQRQPAITSDIAPDLHAYLGGIVRELRGTALAINGTADHVHLLVRVPPVKAVADIARVIKTNSSRWLHERWPEKRQFAWQTGYGAFSVSESNVDAVRNYIYGQAEHHKARSFQEEFVAFLKRNNISYDEGYIWN